MDKAEAAPRLALLEKLYKKMPRCSECHRKATRETIANGARCDEHAKGWLTTALPWGSVIRALEKR